MEERVTRREALKKLGQWGLISAGLSGILPRALGHVEAATVKPKLVVASGGKLFGRLQAVLKEVGGIESFVKKGSKVLIKPNVGWARTPEQGANTNPDLVFYLIKMCYSAGAKEVVIYEHSCDNYTSTFQLSGIKDAVERAGGKIFSADSEAYYMPIEVPAGKILKKVNIVKYIREADCFINFPIAKNHSAAVLTLGMKNMMGLIWDRGRWHISGLDQCIADFMTAVKPNLTIVDATRILTTGGPKGPGKVKELNTLIATTDFVAADSYAATLFGKKGMTIPHIRNAHSMGLGQAEIENMTIKTI
jgi:uncharacterized protein (DUF362 family)